MKYRDADEIVRVGQAARMVIAKVATPLELATDQHLASRNYWPPGDKNELGPLFQLKSSKFGRPRVKTVQDALLFGGLSEVNRKNLPLSGIRVLDLTTAWSGPMATRLLAGLGATIIKVEGPSRIDDWRGPISGGLSSRYPDLDPGERPFDRCFQFNTQNVNKFGLTLDLKDPEGVAIALGIASKCDVVISNFSAGTLDRLGLGWEAISKINPSVIYLEMPAYGAGGHMESHVALGPSMEMASGMAALIGYGDGKPTITGPAYLDPIGGFNGGVTLITSLLLRDRLSRGFSIELAQREGAMQWIGEEIIAAKIRGTDRIPHGNSLTSAVPHDVFPCDGEDEWIVLVALDDAAFKKMWEFFFGDKLKEYFQYETIELRRKNQQLLYEKLANSTRQYHKHELAENLQRLGLLVSSVFNARDLYESQYLRDRNNLKLVTHSIAGTHLYQDLPLHIAGLDTSVHRPAPFFGQDSNLILAEMFSISIKKIGELREKFGVVDLPIRI